MIKTYLKTLFRMFKKHYARLLSLFLMVLISVGFVSGIGSATDKIDYSLDEYYKTQTVSDFIIKSKTGRFGEDDIAEVEEIFQGATINIGNSVDLQPYEEEKRSLRVYFLDFDNWTVNVPDIIKGTAPADTLEVYCEQADDVIEGYGIGDEVKLDLSSLNAFLPELTVKVTAIIQSPLTFALGGEPSYHNPEDSKIDTSVAGTKDMDCLKNILYVSKKALPEMFRPFLSEGDMYVAIEDRGLYSRFSDGYKNYIREKKQEVESKLTDARVITLEDNYSFLSLDYYSEKVEQIGFLLMAAFLFVTALVALSTMTRLIEEERQQIACLKTLGYSSFGIISKYLLFAVIATGIGGLAAYFVGLGLSHFIYYVFNYSFYMPPVTPRIAIVFYIINFVMIFAATIGATAVAGFKMTAETPASMLRPKPPKAGKKVILEKIPLIWNRLSFKYKSTVRNVLRYKSRFILTVVAVAISMALIMAGIALIDLCLFGGFDSPALLGVAVVVVIFAGFLTATVIYTLMTISISERNREIATLMVLGYKDNEVSGYIFREIYINMGVGIIFGYPASALLVWFLLDVIVMKTFAALDWVIWFIAPLVVILFTGLVTLILYPKIIKIDMNESLKAIE